VRRRPKSLRRQVVNSHVGRNAITLSVCMCLCILQDGKNQVRLEGPPVLDEGAISLEEKKRLWPFTQIEPGGGKFHRGIE